MFYKLAAASFAVLCTVAAQSTPYAEVYNGLGQTIYFQLVNSAGVYDSSSIEPDQGHEITLGPQVSMKMDLDGSFTNPYQFEFNYDSSAGQTYYDFSAVNGDPFSGSPRSITPTNSGCEAISCAAGDNTNDCQFTTTNNFNPPVCSGTSGLLFNVVIGGSPISK